MSPEARTSQVPAPRYLLVDGHSILHAWPELRKLHRQQPSAARDQLIRLLSGLHDSGRWTVTLVFDGQKGGRQERPRDSMAVLYASTGQTADSIIERIAQAHAGKAEIGVVTADHAERTAVESNGAYAFSPEWLKSELAAADLEIEENLRRKKLT